MKTEHFFDLCANCKSVLTEALLEFVRENGEDVTQYEINEFGLEDDEDYHVTKVYNFFDNGGCYFNVARNKFQSIKPEDYKTVDEVFEKLDDEYLHNAFQCLYIEVDNETGHETLKYYNLWNTGVYFSDEMSEPEHGDVYELNLSELETIMGIITYTENNNHNTDNQ